MFLFMLLLQIQAGSCHPRVSEQLRSPFLSAGLCFLGILTKAVGMAGPGGWMVLSSVLHLKHESHNVSTEATLVFEGETCPLQQ